MEVADRYEHSPTQSWKGICNAIADAGAVTTGNSDGWSRANCAGIIIRVGNRKEKQLNRKPWPKDFEEKILIESRRV
jgi:hypothetical protein